MRTHQPTASPLYPKIRFAFTDHPIMVWAGAILLRLYFELMGLRAALVPLLVPLTKTTDNQTPCHIRATLSDARARRMSTGRGSGRHSCWVPPV